MFITKGRYVGKLCVDGIIVIKSILNQTLGGPIILRLLHYLAASLMNVPRVSIHRGEFVPLDLS